MKTRLHDQYMRFRLDQSDVQTLCDTGSVLQCIGVGSSNLSFEIKLTNEKPSAHFVIQCVEVLLPTAWTAGWAGNEVVGFDFDVLTDDGDVLRIVVEKDFPCAHTADGRAVYGKPERKN
ncbi:MAG: hypothetical protein HOC28_10830 [Bacteroidetes Order II. Incertae sedis bacterium]|jgi:hypothetical protein|nr:hypothetical protein [Bacteroidetes Order II. bacterium]MDG1755737.1 hypothetical protein [Rhodothermales bacterium]HAY37735.1 hypothetical protein [Bacteroidota bacterium]MBT4052305.1 hypothetical protein [Bacteroidetes Order II. bacterium]MBT4603620.1 hypothetical protein [Bacteroidetes Order II. bacterium]